jgi:hypothetical protein
VDGGKPLDFGVLDAVQDHDLIQLKKLAVMIDIKKEEEENTLVEDLEEKLDIESEEDDEFDPNEIIDPDDGRVLNKYIVIMTLMNAVNR